MLKSSLERNKIAFETFEGTPNNFQSLSPEDRFKIKEIKDGHETYTRYEVILRTVEAIPAELVSFFLWDCKSAVEIANIINEQFPISKPWAFATASSVNTVTYAIDTSVITLKPPHLAMIFANKNRYSLVHGDDLGLNGKIILVISK